MFHMKNRRQLTLVNIVSLNDKKVQSLSNTIYGLFRNSFLPKLPAKLFAKHFHIDQGRKTKDVQSMLGLFILQAMLDLKDSQAVESFVFDQRFHYALDIKEKETNLSPRAYYYYKQLLLGRERQIFDSVLADIFDNINFEYNLQRTDSSLVQLNLKKMSQWELFKSTLVKTLKEIKKNFPIIYNRVPESLQKYMLSVEKNTWFTDFSAGKADEYLLQAAKDALDLKDLFKDHPKVSKLEAFKLLLRLIDERVSFDEQENIVVKLKNDCKGSAMVSPHDPQAQYNGHKKKVGVKVTVSETCAPDKETPNPQIITNVEVSPANLSDQDILQPTVDARENRGFKPDTELTDNGFESDANHQALKEKGVDLIAPPTGKAPDGFGIIDFNLHDDQQSIKACPMGQACLENKVNQHGKKTTSYFDPDQCRTCPHSQDCPVKITKRKARVIWNWNKPRLEAKRIAFQTDQELINLFKQRAGGEACFSQLKVNFGLQRLRCRGFAKAKFKIIMATIALNIIRTFNWITLQGSSPPKKRKTEYFDTSKGKILSFFCLFRLYLHYLCRFPGFFQKIRLHFV